jgi:hypothetical protein
LPAHEGFSIDWICENVTLGKMGCITDKHFDKAKWDKIESEVPTAVAVKSIVLCEVTLCILVEVH